MKASVSLATVLLALGPAVASAQVVNGVLSGQPTAVPRALRERDDLVNRAACNADNVLRDLRNPTRSVAASSFCSSFLQPTTTVTATTTIPQTQVITSQTTETDEVTSTLTTAVATTTVLCPPSPTASLTCGFKAYGYGSYLISQTAGLSAAACEQKCLANPSCQSYQIQQGGASYCNLYNVNTAAHVQAAPSDNFYFYDRDCADNAPAACNAAAAKHRRHMDRREVAIPTYLATVPPTRISSACRCFITSADPTATVTTVVPVTSVTTVTTVVATTVTLVDVSTLPVTTVIASTVS